MKKNSVREDERDNNWEKTMDKANSILGFKLRFLGKNENQIIHNVEVKNINFQDLMRHLQRGESVSISPKLLENSSAYKKKHEDQASWYFAHT